MDYVREGAQRTVKQLVQQLIDWHKDNGEEFLPAEFEREEIDRIFMLMEQISYEAEEVDAFTLGTPGRKAAVAWASHPQSVFTPFVLWEALALSGWNISTEIVEQLVCEWSHLSLEDFSPIEDREGRFTIWHRSGALRDYTQFMEAAFNLYHILLEEEW